jgi:hypothetical protein
MHIYVYTGGRERRAGPFGAVADPPQGCRFCRFCRYEDTYAAVWDTYILYIYIYMSCIVVYIVVCIVVYIVVYIYIYLSINLYVVVFIYIYILLYIYIYIVGYIWSLQVSMGLSSWFPGAKVQILTSTKIAQTLTSAKYKY